MAEKERASRQVIVISLITAACLIGDSMLYIVLPICFAQAGLSSLWEVGIILSVNRLVRLPLNPMVGWLYRHISDRTGIFIATVLATITTFSYAFADGFAVWLLLRCLWGIAWTLLRLGGFYCILNVSSDDNRGYFMGLYNGLYRIGSLAGMLLGGIFADWLGFSVTCMLFGACTAATIVLGFLCVPRGNSGRPGRNASRGAVFDVAVEGRHGPVGHGDGACRGAYLSRPVRLHAQRAHPYPFREQRYLARAGWPWARQRSGASCKLSAGGGSRGWPRGSAYCPIAASVGDP